MAEIVVPLTIRNLTHEDLPSCAWSGWPATWPPRLAILGR
jgi:hypothetical protein